MPHPISAAEPTGLARVVGGAGESAAAEARLHRAGLVDPATENIMVTGARGETTLVFVSLRATPITPTTTSPPLERAGAQL